MIVPPHFTFAYWCLLAMALLPLACSWLAKSGGFGKPRREGGFDNRDPRPWLDKQTGWHARANAAQANTFEALPFFMAAVIIAHQLGARQAVVDLLAFAFVLIRVIYVALYVGGMARTRSAFWALGLLVNIAILFAGYR